MSNNSTQPKTKTPTDADLKGNPGIGQSKGTERVEDIEELELDSTLEGDVMNETRTDGSVDPQHTGRTNT